MNNSKDTSKTYGDDSSSDTDSTSEEEEIDIDKPSKSMNESDVEFMRRSIREKM